jgi:hypothetical protein
MSYLVKLLKKIENENVNTSEYLNEYYLKKFAFSKGSNEETRLWLDNAKQNQNLKMFIGGYGDADSENGAGHTRLVQNAEYWLHLFAIQSNVKLTKPISLNTYSFGAPSDNLQAMENYLIEHCVDDASAGYPTPHIPGDISNIFTSKHIIYKKVNLLIGENNSKNASDNGPNRFLVTTGKELISNVHKKGVSYYGDITLHVNAPMVLGNNCLVQRDYKIKEPLRTDKVLFSRSLAGSGLRCYMDKRIDILSNFVDGSKIAYDSKNWLLLVGNV